MAIIDNVSNAMNAIAIGRKHQEIMMRWVGAQEKGNQTQKFWDELQKEYNDFEKEIYGNRI